MQASILEKQNEKKRIKGEQEAPGDIDAGKKADVAKRRQDNIVSDREGEMHIQIYI